MTDIISVISGKGGVGKTTVVSNLGCALAKRGKKVLVIDGNVTGASLALHLGVPDMHPTSLNDVLENKAFLTQAIYNHPSGFLVIPAKLNDLEANLGGLEKHLGGLVGTNDVILIDAAAGVSEEVEAAVNVSDKVLIVTNPEHAAVLNALTAKKLAQKKGKDILGIALNNVRGEKHELTCDQIEALLEVPIIAKIPHQWKVLSAISKRQPFVETAPKSAATKAIHDLSYTITGETVPKEKMMQKLGRAVSKDFVLRVE